MSSDIRSQGGMEGYCTCGSTLAGRRMMKIDMISKTVKASETVGQMYEKLKCLMPTMEAVPC